jgi:hypothetical protein
LTAEEYRSLAERNGLCVDSIRIQDKAWTFETRGSFAAWCRGGFVEWTSRLPEDERDSFIADVLDHYRPMSSSSPDESNTFKFYQMDVTLRSP